MSDNSKPFAGGLLVAAGLIVGATIGVVVGESSLGFVIGLAVGGGAAALLAMRRG